ncbi:MAG: UbiA family prenyltransferase [Bryobacterales bacterium]|nr:UbiA family prenyltransferase [Bryobacterales bacterium]
MAYSDSHSLPLCIDLDGTLVKTDMLFESLARLLKHKPWLILLVPFWCLLGRAALKRKLASHVSIDVGSLPYNNALIAWLRVQKNRKRQLLLVTAADEQLAQPIADHLGFFDRVLASNGILNLKGKDKFRVLRQQVEGEFEYAGDSPADLEIWRHCHSAVTVGASPSLLRQIRKHVPEVKTFDGRRTSWMHYLAALRIHQWAKNVLIYVPLITAHRLQLDLMLEATFCVVVFGLCSSAQYILNDLVDLEADRAHPKKRERPFASGDIPLPVGFVLAPLLLVVSLGAAWFYSKALVALLAAYFLFSLTYSLYLKRIVLVDTFCLSTLYLLRIVAGHVVTGVAFSVWLLSFAFFLFLSLAFSKRWTELDLVRRTNGAMNGRGYGLDDTLQVNLFGVCSAFLSAVVFILYLQSDKVKELYRTPELLWILSPIYLYWISRIWILSTRGQVQEDPVVFVMKDRVTYLVGALCGLVMLAASRGWLT